MSFSQGRGVGEGLDEMSRPRGPKTGCDEKHISMFLYDPDASSTRRLTDDVCRGGREDRGATVTPTDVGTYKDSLLALTIRV